MCFNNPVLCFFDFFFALIILTVLLVWPMIVINQCIYSHTYILNLLFLQGFELIILRQYIAKTLEESAMKPSIQHQLHTSQRQTQKISARQIQSLHILQMDQEALIDAIHEEFERNPFIDCIYPSQSSGIEVPKRTTPGQSEDFTSYTAVKTTMQEHLTEQLIWLHLSKEELQFCKFLIGLLDENGFLKEAPEELSRTFHLPLNKLLRAKSILQSLDPPGIAASGLQECLELQLRARGALTPVLQKIIHTQLHRIAEDGYAAIAEELHISIQEAKQSADQIRRLDPLPGNALSENTSAPTPYIFPELRAVIIGGKIVISFLEEIYPRVSLCQDYEIMLKNSKPGSELHEYLSDRRDSAVQFLSAIRQRQDTIINIARKIADRQRSCFLCGPQNLVPLTQTEIAQSAGISVSTVSRAVNGKYIDCPFGIYELKDFFSFGITKKDGSAISSRVILQKIKTLILNESHEDPLSDQRISELLIREGIPISRRTVTKYRSRCRIPPASKRRH